MPVAFAILEKLIELALTYGPTARKLWDDWRDRIRDATTSGTDLTEAEFQQFEDDRHAAVAKWKAGM